MKAIWTQREASFQGEHVRFERIWADPKPLQTPHPPVLIGGDGERTFDRVVEFGDGWMPILRPNRNPVDRIPELHARLRQAGRDPKTAPVSIFFAPPKREALDAMAGAGVARAIFGVPSEPRDKVLPRLDAYAKLIG
jgi:alkanesulfonate monooxygenase SsuD/methylene tetrahydromethanopterin reductase-like flavin-dependent oxidoreductase (luciferase family)